MHVRRLPRANNNTIMKKDIILCGVGGQGILSIATIIGEAATAAGLNLKQAEVHGMSQRGGDVQSNLRLSTDVIISMEPMEALRYLPYLSKDGAVVTSSQSFVNIPNYPDSSAIDAELAKLPKVAKLDIEQIAKEVATVRSANVVLLGMAAPYIGILSTDELRSAVARVFQRKGDAIVEANLKAFDAGVAAVG